MRSNVVHLPTSQANVAHLNKILTIFNYVDALDNLPWIEFLWTFMRLKYKCECRGYNNDFFFFCFVFVFAFLFIWTKCIFYFVIWMIQLYKMNTFIEKINNKTHTTLVLFVWMLNQMHMLHANTSGVSFCII